METIVSRPLITSKYEFAKRECFRERTRNQQAFASCTPDKHIASRARLTNRINRNWSTDSMEYKQIDTSFGPYCMCQIYWQQRIKKNGNTLGKRQNEGRERERENGRLRGKQESCKNETYSLPIDWYQFEYGCNLVPKLNA